MEKHTNRIICKMWCEKICYRNRAKIFIQCLNLDVDPCKAHTCGGIYNLDRFMPGICANEIIHCAMQRRYSNMWTGWWIGSNIMCVACVYHNRETRAQCQITAITWVVNLIQSIHPKCFVNTHTQTHHRQFDVIFFSAFLLHSMNSNICRTNIWIHLFCFAFHIAVLFLLQTKQATK